MDESRVIEQIYQKISNAKTNYGLYHKTLFHLHTPASHDYKMFAGWEAKDYQNLTEEKLIEICRQRRVMPPIINLSEVNLENEKRIYDSRKEWLSYLLVANEIVENDYEIVVVTDHHNINGVEKLELAVKDIHGIKKNHPYPEIIFGIEISCADRLHVVGIFDKKYKESVKKWILNNLLNERDGTYLTSLAVIEYFKKEIDGISYIAHINSSQFFSDDKFMSGAYKKKLIEAGCFEFIGIHEKGNIPSVNQLLNNNNIHTKGFVIDNDAHTVDEINKNYFWIKSGKRSFKTLKEAFDDFEISISLINETKNRKYIKGIFIEKGGFLEGKDEKDFMLRFSNSLNCFIGGRGTGKSTVLQVIDYTLGQRVESESMLDFICSHGNIWVLFVDGDKEYVIRMNNPIKQNTNERILRYFGQNEDDKYHYSYYFSKEKIKDYCKKKYLMVYEITKDNLSNTVKVTSVAKSSTLCELYDTRYSVNELVQTASGDKIDEFIRQLMFQNKILSSPEKIIQCRSKNGLKKAILDMENLFDIRKKEVNEIINPFNKKMKGTLQIIYRQNEVIEEPDFERWLFNEKRKNRHKGYFDLNISEENVIEYLYYICRNVGIISLLRMALKEENRFQFNISDFFDLNHSNSSEKEKLDAIDVIFDNLITDENYSQIISYLRDMVSKSEKLSLEFNINSRTTVLKKVEYRDVRNLSLGQKVVAMLDFIFGYGDFIDDTRPIMIDQPEDNLDSQYIYMNLIQQLREIKDKRQIIIATHNAAIVTNAMADQVCVMCSNGKHGWVERAGYPSEDVIKKDIVNYLEGGIDSFKHKMKVYKPVIDR